MSFTDKLKQIGELQQRINSSGKLPEKVLQSINYKFRLEWNYNSNIMEGNSLTRQETRSVMVGNITIGGKPLKDVLEMKGHDEVVKEIMKMGSGALNITENRIKEIHKVIMHEDAPEEQKKIGVWKTQNNYLYNYKNEKVDFVPFSEVQERMHQLINWLNAEKEKIQKRDKDAMNPVALAFKFHLDYITIHPFYDGNGRTARIFTNLALVAYGYPPLYIKPDEKDRYYRYLADVQEYGGAPDLFYDFMGDMLVRSQQIVLDAIEGKEIEEPDEWEKKLQLLKTQNAQKEHFKQKKTTDSLNEVITKGVFPLIEQLMIKLSGYDELFAEKKIMLYQNNAGNKVEDIDAIKKMYQTDQDMFSHNFRFEYALNGYKHNGKNPFNCEVYIQWQFDDFMYYTWINNNDNGIKSFYDEMYTAEEIKQYANDCGALIMKQIEKRTGK